MLSGADLTGANLEGAKLEHARMAGAVMTGAAAEHSDLAVAGADDGGATRSASDLAQ